MAPFVKHEQVESQEKDQSLSQPAPETPKQPDTQNEDEMKCDDVEKSPDASYD